MVIIRLQRGGSKKRPFYHIIVTDNRSSRDGRFIEKIGFFNPMVSEKEKCIYLNIERFHHWKKIGVKMSDKVLYLYKKYNE